MAKARAIVKRRKAVRNIKKITKTMQMIRDGQVPEGPEAGRPGPSRTRTKIRELVAELAATPSATTPTTRCCGRRRDGQDGPVLVITSDRGLAGAYNGSVLRAANAFIRGRGERPAATVELYVSGKKGVSYFNFQRRPIVGRFDQFADQPEIRRRRRRGRGLHPQFTDGKVDERPRGLHAVHQRRPAEGRGDAAAPADDLADAAAQG